MKMVCTMYNCTVSLSLRRPLTREFKSVNRVCCSIKCCYYFRFVKCCAPACSTFSLSLSLSRICSAWKRHQEVHTTIIIIIIIIVVVVQDVWSARKAKISTGECPACVWVCGGAHSTDSVGCVNYKFMKILTMHTMFFISICHSYNKITHDVPSPSPSRPLFHWFYLVSDVQSKWHTNCKWTAIYLVKIISFASWTFLVSF